MGASIVASRELCLIRIKMNIYAFIQGCRVRVGVRVAQSPGNKPGVGVGVGVDQAASTVSPDCLLQFVLVRASRKYFSVKFSRLSPFSNFLANIDITMKDSNLKPVW